jgi:acyl-CoA synthetase (AMP-forming)/AMP-acid ligase II
MIGYSSYRDWSLGGWRAHLPDVADLERFVADLGADTIPALAAASADRFPGRVAVTVDGEPVTHAELDDAANRVAAWLAGQVDVGDRVLLAAGSSLGFVRCYLGALRAGAVVVLANPGYTAAELGHLVADSGAVLAFADHEPARRLAGLPEPPQIVDAGDHPDGPAPGRMSMPRPQDTALLAYTSGTTGRPKGVPLTHRQLSASIRSAMAAWRWSADDVLAHTLPLYHQHGLGGLHAALIAGGTVHLRSKFSPAGLAQMVTGTRASVMFAVPALYQALVDASEAGGGWKALRLAVCGSAPLSPALAERLPGMLGRVPLVRYGTTESGLNVSQPLAYPRPDTVGVPLPGVLARIRTTDPAADPGANVAGDLGADGEIQLRGPQVFAGYWRDPAASEAAFTTDGWFRTGDIGAVDPATGHLMIRGRTKEMIITGGLNVYPREVEIALEGHPAVAEAAVAGVPDDRWGERVTGWVVLRDGHDFDEAGLIAHAHTLLAGYKCPKRVFQLAALPRNPLGKIIRSALG